MKPRAKPVLAVADRFTKHRLFSQAGAKLIREHGGRGTAVAADVWQVLWSFEDAKTGTSQVGRRYLAELVGVDPGQVHRGLAVLKELGFLDVLVKGTSRTAAVYQLFGYPPGRQPRMGTQCPRRSPRSG